MTPAVIALIFTAIGLLSAACAAFYKIVRALTKMEKKLDTAMHLSAYVPGLWWDVETIKKHLNISTPQMPMFADHDAEE